MKRRWLACFTTLSVAVILTIFSSAGIAQGFCIELLAGNSNGSTLGCDLTGSDAEYCYYDCECFGDWSECERIADSLGLEFID
jgi:hypothetical protein